ncbi:MAG: 30S ribosomal protein S21 [Candidatus Obscuribacterales bacterium]|nr:30S ribosomal protein S21 [Cyanobacteria bacterium HKST-UBA01]MCB9471773.1 30S ribosomal protein S21 [Candidatus Obscuribacterales bacterium]
MRRSINVSVVRCANSEFQTIWFSHKCRHHHKEQSLYVRVSENESIERALKRFKKQVQKAAILSDYKRKRYFESTSEKRRRKAAAAAQRRKKKRHSR